VTDETPLVTDNMPSVTDDTQVGSVATTPASTAAPLINNTEVEPTRTIRTIRTPTVIVEPESD